MAAGAISANVVGFSRKQNAAQVGRVLFHGTRLLRVITTVCWVPDGIAAL